MHTFLMSDVTCAEPLDTAVLRAERRVRLLEELSEIGMDLARALRREAQAAADEAEPDGSATDAKTGRPTARSGDLAGAFASLSRAIRLTLTLEGRADEALRALRAGVLVEREAQRAEAARRASAAAQARREGHFERIRSLVIDVADREIDDGEALCDLEEVLDERMREDEAYADLENLPLREAVQRLCADLELTPDWSLWTGDGWPPKAPFFRPRTSPYAVPGRTSKHVVEDDGLGVPAPRAHRLE
jgi:hypothetical protein